MPDPNSWPQFLLSFRPQEKSLVRPRAHVKRGQIYFPRQKIKMPRNLTTVVSWQPLGAICDVAKGEISPRGRNDKRNKMIKGTHSRHLSSEIQSFPFVISTPGEISSSATCKISRLFIQVMALHGKTLRPCRTVKKSQTPRKRGRGYEPKRCFSVSQPFVILSPLLSF